MPIDGHFFGITCFIFALFILSENPECIHSVLNPILNRINTQTSDNAIHSLISKLHHMLLIQFLLQICIIT